MTKRAQAEEVVRRKEVARRNWYLLEECSEESPASHGHGSTGGGPRFYTFQKPNPPLLAQINQL
jgi:hypothetical protein